jgi:regulator of protease activity HflC (stomatin/prohibitin superfamily)
MHEERLRKIASGWPHLFLNILFYAAAVASYLSIIRTGTPINALWGTLLLFAAILHSAGFFIVNPNEAAVLLLFGAYKGTVKNNGFHWANPFYRKIKISLRMRNLVSEKIKVNDLIGNPIEIAAVIVWQVHNTSEALFDVDDYHNYITTQSEAAIRHLASSYPYDGSETELTLRGATDQINTHLQKELQDRLGRAGVTVTEARLSHLAYASEIAGAMLQRQQATAIVAARQKIVEGAVGMVEMALAELSRKAIVQLDDERKAAMVSNLLVVLCSERAAAPVVNTGTLYS